MVVVVVVGLVVVVDVVVAVVVLVVVGSGCVRISVVVEDVGGNAIVVVVIMVLAGGETGKVVLKAVEVAPDDDSSSDPQLATIKGRQKQSSMMDMRRWRSPMPCFCLKASPGESTGGGRCSEMSSPESGGTRRSEMMGMQDMAEIDTGGYLITPTRLFTDCERSLV